jgi:hypothetical protein
MMVWGQFFLPATISPAVLVVFWTVCFLFTMAAVMVAFSDLHALRHRTREEQRVLMEETMHEIEREVRKATARSRN